MGKCELCSKEGSRMEANHKELGRIMVCQDCWANLYDKNRMTCSVDASGGSCSCCSCRQVGRRSWKNVFAQYNILQVEIPFGDFVSAQKHMNF